MLIWGEKFSEEGLLYGQFTERLAYWVRRKKGELGIQKVQQTELQYTRMKQV
jgi:hypothetical protein